MPVKFNFSFAVTGFRALLWMCAILCAPGVSAAEPLVITPADSYFSIAEHVDVLEDPSAALTIDEVDSAVHRDDFRPAVTGRDHDINFGYSTSAYWLRLNIDARDVAAGRMLLEVAFPSLDHVALYAASTTGWQHQEAGDLLPFSARSVANRNFVFPVPLAEGRQTLYLRVQSSGTLTIPVHLWSENDFAQHNQNTYGALALYFGMLLALLLYNLLLYLSLRERVYLNYVCFVASLAVGLLSLSGFGNQFLWPGFPGWGNVALPMGFAATGLFGVFFTRSFLDTKTITPRHDRVLQGLAVLFALTLLACLVLPYRWGALAVSLLGATTPVVVISCGVVALRNGHAGARYFLLAWALLMTGVSMMGARNLGWMPTNFFTLYGIQIGSSLEMLLLSFALADRIQIMRREKEAAQNDVIHAIGRRLQSVVNTIPDYIFYKDRDGRFLGCNTAFETLLGRREADIIGKTVNEIVPESEAQFFRWQDAQLLADGETQHHEEWITAAGNKRVLLDMVKALLYDAQGNVTGMIGVGRNITERQRNIEQERARNMIFESLARGGELPEILRYVVNTIESSRSGAFCSILLLDKEGKHLLLGAAPSLPDAYNNAVHGLPIGECVGSCGTAAFRGERVIVEDIYQHPYWMPYTGILELAKQAGLVSCWSEPIRSSKGVVLGTFAIYRKEPGAPDESDIQLIQQAANLASIAIERKLAEDLIWQQANFDNVTQLPNRSLFRDRLEQEMRKTYRHNLKLALLFIDLDHFKEVNDTLGHDAGDLLLVEAARRINTCVRDSDTVARIGGDEFTVILAQLDDTGRVEQVAQKIIDAVAAPFQLGDESVYISASLGITLYPDDGFEAEDLLKNADQAMYVAKSRGRNGFSYFTSQMQEQAQHRQSLIKDLREALSAKQLRVYFQPIIDLDSGEIIKAEALIRWLHPRRGLVSPAEFIPLAEETGLIGEIGDWVFKEAAAWMGRWHTQGYTCQQVSVNKSPSQFIVDDKHGSWVEHLRDIGLPGECVVIEITEGLLLDAREDVTKSLLNFRDAGIQVALDDFGTGYSSLSYLKKFDIDYLKIDRAFVHDLATDPNDLALSEAIIVMAHKLGLKVVAEGVETVEQRDILRNAGCDFAQGFLYAKPMPAEEFDALLASGKQLL
jgi:diguanylate cyclase (GGDEF)-like protein/PAS domain S-box-containing protein